MPDGPFHLVPAFVLVFFRLAGMMLFAPLFGSTRVPKRVKVLLTLVMAMSMLGAVNAPVVLPDTTWGLTLAIAGEMVFGFAMGLSLSMVFIAVQWAGDMMGKQMGLHISEVFDPQFGGGGSLVGDLYFMLTLAIFLIIGGHRAMLTGVYESFAAFPLLTLTFSESVFQLVLNMLAAATTLAIRMASPMLLTMLVVDLVMGCIGKSMPQMNIMTIGLSLRSMVGMVMSIVAVTLAGRLLEGELIKAIDIVRVQWSMPQAL
jgi:flagellar biosynthesis protein FliR